MTSLFHVVVTRLRSLWRSGHLDQEFDRELETHLALAEADHMRRGLTREQAHRAARVELGGLTQLREAGHAARGLPWLGTFWLDIKLGVRMLRKYWGLTMVGGLAMTVAIAIGAGVFAVLDTAGGSRLPLDEGDRIVALQTWDLTTRRGYGTTTEDFWRWRDAARALEDVGAFRAVQRGLTTGDGSPESVTVAEMTASGFQLARVPPLVGRPLVEDDELEGAAPVVVIGADVWRSRFAADPATVGQQIRLGDIAHTVVGVMPADFGFPLNHRFWAPLRLAPGESLSDESRTGVIFARLSPGATLEGAQTELATMGLLPSAVDTATAERLQPRVMPYTSAFLGGLDRWVARLIVFLVSLLLVPPCANIAILVYARTIARQQEFAARYALGASRARIVGQLFIEVLVLASGAAGLALILTRMLLSGFQGQVVRDLGGTAPFWMDFSLSPRTILFAAGLAVFAAVIAGVLPAIKSTGRLIQSGLRSLGGRTGMQLGTTWTVLVVAQVAVSLAALPTAAEMAWGTLRSGILGPGFEAEEHLTARLAMDLGTSPDPEAAEPALSFAVGAFQAEFLRQLRAEPGVLDVSVMATVPNEEPWVPVVVEGAPLAEDGVFTGDDLIR
jgi:putative ABC transport system permease protein